jgi:(1->4)-alpha-D-glucan 1-alpha-D-glucosylmutase
MLVLKAITPGVPDLYQGTELWDFSLTDPDNRRPINYARRRQLLDDLPPSDAPAPERALAARALLTHWQDGRIKLHLTRALLHLRRAHPDLFAHGSYQVLNTTGSRKDHVLAVARHHRRKWVVAVVPRQMIGVMGSGRFPKGERAWAHTAVRLPHFVTGEMADVFTGTLTTAKGKQIRLNTYLSILPVCVLTNVRTDTGS